MKNKLLYNASIALVQCSSFVKPLDPDYAKELLDKAQEFMDQIVIDENVEKEVNEFEKQIKQGL